MKTLYLECGMGASGDMLCAALLELFDDKSAMIETLNAIGLSGARFFSEPSVKHGIKGTRFIVEVSGLEEGDVSQLETKSARSLGDVLNVIGGLNIPEQARRNASEIYSSIALAEAEVHGEPVGDVHFHEVGSIDAIGDITAFCLMLDSLGVDRVVASPVATGYGYVRCAHGVLPVPSPAAALLLRGVPVYSGEVEGELCTPTGAALLKHFASGFSRMPQMTVAKIGYGMGKKDFCRANCVRAFFGECEQTADAADGGTVETVAELKCALDDMTPERVAYAQQKLLESGALDATVTPAIMKKGRAGVTLECLCRQDESDKFARLIFKHTSTLGVRVRETKRYIMKRRETTAETNLGPVRVKVAGGFGVKKQKPEHEDLARLAGEAGVSLGEIEYIKGNGAVPND
ncbi:MAG: nickel pincer cofactor biosynthesis protein LarC [Defluviitaleaceae bacterium]|nr:nickel pincer cofactor biosynthesis protein LarC [Defluviitaleaceae bacterium]